MILHFVVSGTPITWEMCTSHNDVKDAHLPVLDRIPLTDEFIKYQGEVYGVNTVMTILQTNSNPFLRILLIET
jgi:hypothetical protein